MGEQLPPGVLHVYRRRIWLRLLRLDGLGRAGDLRERLQSDAAKPVRGRLLVHVLPGPSYAAPHAEPHTQPYSSALEAPDAAAQR